MDAAKSIKKRRYQLMTNSNFQLALVKFAAFISVNLAVVNALPFPGLDGGQVCGCVGFCF